MNIQFLYSAMVKYIINTAIKGIIRSQDIYIAAVAILVRYKLRAIMYGAKMLSALDVQNHKLLSAVLYTGEPPTSNSQVPNLTPETGIQSNSGQLVISRQSANNITYQLRAFYRFDRLLSVASLQRWLEDANYLSAGQPSLLSIVYEHNNCNVYAAQIDLDYDIEQLSGKPIPNSSIELSNLPRVLLYMACDSQ